MYYVALLRGINVGGNNIIKMAELKACFESCGFEAVQTYIQSGNVMFSARKRSRAALISDIEAAIVTTFGFPVFITLLEHAQLKRIVTNAPTWWGKDETWKHNLLVLLPGYGAEAVIRAIGPLKSGIELIAAGDGVIYQSLSFKKFGQTTSGRLATMPEYKAMTIRSYSTVHKLVARMEQNSL